MRSTNDGLLFLKKRLMNLCSRRTAAQKVLLMAGDEANMEIVSQLIGRRADLELLTALNGQIGMKLAATSQLGVVVVDTELSDISAQDVLGLLRGNLSTSHIPVIALSAYASQAQIDAGLQVGFYRYITSPYQLADVMDAIDASLRDGLSV
jgi:CheY-like chemotaxis protein